MRMALEHFHPAVAAWFASAFPEPTAAQMRAWPAIKAGRHTLIAAPTGSGKTLSAFMAAIDDLVRHGMEMPLPDETTVVYVSPLKALSNDIRINLDAPIAGIRDKLLEMGLPDVEIRTAVRTGDTPQSERIGMRKRPPHIVVTTPESLYILLGSESGRAMLATTRTVIVDEIHALAPSKRGAHLALSLERLESLCQRKITRIGLSATQKPISEVAKYLLGGNSPDECEIVDVGYSRKRDLAVEVPPMPLQAVMSGDGWELVYSRIAELIQQHRTTLIFVNTRRMAERAARHLSEKLGKEAVSSHHGSLSRELRLNAEQRLKRGELRALVATSSLELGIDVGDVDLVCQISSPRSISTFLQRVGRSGHAVIGTPKGRLFPQSRDDLIECAALLDCVRRGELDELKVEKNSLDVLAQQIVAEVACREWNEADLLALCKRSYPFAELSKEVFTDILRMLAEGYTTRRGPRSAYLHRDAVNGVLRARKGARLTAITSGGAIPDTADYEVMLEPQAQRVGTVHEDFAVESLAGDVFQLGNTSYRILRVESGRVRVEDAKGQPPTIPFWLGEAPGRTNELSFAVSRLREEISERLEDSAESAQRWLRDDVSLPDSAARQIVDYLGGAKAALGILPTQTDLAMERFFDESGGTQLVIHTPYGSRLNRAWGLALRKRFCRTFNFELQAAATEDAIVLSLSTSHSFPLEEVTHYLHSNSVCDVLTQALLDAPMFGVRWRWNATTALALPRFQGGSKVPPQLQRMKSEDLLASVFPDQVACLENIVGERHIPEHPMVAQTLHDCLYEAMDLSGLEQVLKNLESGKIHFVCRDLTAPSPLAAEVLTARPYAYLDDAPLEERRTQAVMSRQWGDINSTDDFGKLDADAIASVRDEAWPQVRTADELHEALMVLGFVTHSEIASNGWNSFLDELIAQRRTTQLQNDALIWITAERIPQFQAIFTDAAVDPRITAPEEFTRVAWTREVALADVVRGRMTGLGPVTVPVVADSVQLPASDIDLALIALETEGFVMRGYFTPGSTDIEWCERHLLARIHRYTVNRLRREIEPVEPRDFMRFLFEWQRVAPGAQVSGPDALAGIIAQLEGFEAPAAAWETELLPARVAGYEISWLDDLCLAGRVVWSRMHERKSSGERSIGPVRATPIVLLQRRNIHMWTTLDSTSSAAPMLGSRAQAVADYLNEHGASFFDEITSGTRLLQTELEDALAELVAAGIINSDSFAGLRALLVPASKRLSHQRRRGRRTALLGIADAGRWALLRRHANDDAKSPSPEILEHIARTLLKRYGVVCWRLLAREADWLPPWRDLLRVYQRLEARGEIRGGRFIAGLSGEQFALSEAVTLLRSMRQKPTSESFVVVSGADPLNLVGNIVTGAKVPALTASKILYRDGVLIATLVGGEFAPLEVMDAATEWTAKSRLLRDDHAPAVLVASELVASDSVH
ncbi:MAG: DEAD/DEAH box helicase [Rudaea sp.]